MVPITIVFMGFLFTNIHITTGGPTLGFPPSGMPSPRDFPHGQDPRPNQDLPMGFPKLEGIIFHPVTGEKHGKTQDLARKRQFLLCHKITNETQFNHHQRHRKFGGHG